MRKTSNLVGRRFGRWLVQHSAGRNHCGRLIWVCRCDCGGSKIVPSSSLLRGESRSCGCLRAEETGKRFSKFGNHDPKRSVFRSEASSYSAMLQRCYNNKRVKYPEYGGRGITVCSRWVRGENGVSGFSCFLDDLGRKPGPGYSLDRINNDLGYSPENCRWATSAVQSRNRRPRQKSRCTEDSEPEEKTSLLRTLSMGDLLSDLSWTARLWPKVSKGPGGCWDWTGAKNAKGYGFLCVGGKHYRVHRLMHLLASGDAADGLEIMHSCDRPSCVNPAHLMPGTHSENMRDMARKRRSRAT